MDKQHLLDLSQWTQQACSLSLSCHGRWLDSVDLQLELSVQEKNGNRNNHTVQEQQSYACVYVLTPQWNFQEIVTWRFSRFMSRPMLARRVRNCKLRLTQTCQSDIGYAHDWHPCVCGSIAGLNAGMECNCVVSPLKDPEGLSLQPLSLIQSI